MRSTRRMSIVATMAATGSLILSACSSVDQEKDFTDDLKTLGYTVVSVKTDTDSLSMGEVGFVASTSKSKKTSSSNNNSGNKTPKSASPKPASSSTSGRPEKDELEAIVTVAGCKVELDRQMDASIATTVKDRDIEDFQVDEVNGQDATNGVFGAPTNAPTAKTVRTFLRNAHYRCFTG